MSYIYNITFVCSPDKESEMLSYIRGELLENLFNAESPARSPELRKVIEAGGEVPGEDHGVSLALSAEFESEELAHLWNDHILLPSLGDFHKKMGQQALFFVTLLEQLAV